MTIDLLPDDDQEQLASQLGAFLEQRRPEMHGPRPDGPTSGPFVDREWWHELGGIGLFGLALADEHHGAGYSLVDEVLAAIEIGRHLAPGPIVATMLGAHVAASGGQETILASILAGDSVVAIGEPLAGSSASGGGPRPRARVLDGDGADFVLVCTPTSVRLLEVGSSDDVEPMTSIDEEVGMSLVPIDRAREIVAQDGDEIWQRGRLLTAAQLCGIAEATRDLSAAHARERFQFDRPIGAFQAVKHRCADMALRAEGARATVGYAALTMAARESTWRFDVVTARVMAAQAAVRNARDNVQNHGATGFTWGNTAHRYLKRTRIHEHAFGTPPSLLADALATAPDSRAAATRDTPTSTS
jgi:alkylation response protein AidB-like acyl-CoA dehydrogenase